MSDLQRVTWIDEHEIYVGTPPGQPYGLYRRVSDPLIGGDKYYEHIPVTPSQEAERDRLRGLRIEAARLTDGDVVQAAQVYDFLRHDPPHPKAA